MVYSIVATNLGSSTASNVVVSATLPLGGAFVGASGGGVLSNGVVSWTVASLASTASTNFSLTITAPASGTLTNTVTKQRCEPGSQYNQQ